MFSRKNYAVDEGGNIPDEWKAKVAALLNQNFKEHCETQKKSFDVFGKIYVDELVIVVSWLEDSDFNQAPISLFLSADIFEQKNTEEALKHLVDISGLFFDEFFSADNWDGYEPNWKETSYKKNDYYYKITRENVALTMEADKLLKENNQKNQ